MKQKVLEEIHSQKTEKSSGEDVMSCSKYQNKNNVINDIGNHNHSTSWENTVVTGTNLIRAFIVPNIKLYPKNDKSTKCYRILAWIFETGVSLYTFQFF